MHELGIAESVLEAVRAEMKKRPGASASKIGLRIGEMTAVDQDALRFAFEVLVRDTEFQALQLEVEVCLLSYQCRDCGNKFAVRNYGHQCSQCGSMNGQCIGGDELDLAYLEIEENEPSAVGTKSTE